MQAFAEQMNQSQSAGGNSTGHPMADMMAKAMSGQCGQTAGSGNPMAEMMAKAMSGQGKCGNNGGWKGCGQGQSSGWKGCGKGQDKQETGKGQDQEQKPWWEKCGKG